MEVKLIPSTKTTEKFLLGVVFLNFIGSLYEIVHVMVYFTFSPTIYLPTLMFMVLSRYWICHKYAGYNWKNLILSFDVFANVVHFTEEQLLNYSKTKFKNELDNAGNNMVIIFPEDVMNEWLINNIKGPYKKEFNKIKFLYKKDAMMFRLVWG